MRNGENQHHPALSSILRAFVTERRRHRSAAPIIPHSAVITG